MRIDAEPLAVPTGTCAGGRPMLTGEIAIERLAHAMIERHGMDAAKAAVSRLNQMIDRRDWEGRERWACVVRAIHENQGVGPAFAPGDRDTAGVRGV
jgi:hypothetical protein